MKNEKNLTSELLEKAKIVTISDEDMDNVSGGTLSSDAQETQLSDNTLNSLNSLDSDSVSNGTDRKLKVR